MSITELDEQSNVFFYAFVTSQTARALEDLRRFGALPPDSRHTVEACQELMRRVMRGQELVEARQRKVPPDSESLQLYQQMLDAAHLRVFLVEGQSVGDAAASFVGVLQALLDGKPVSEISDGALLQLETAISTLASVYAAKTAVATLPKPAEALFDFST